MVNAFLGLPDAVVVVDGADTIVWANRVAERMFGRERDDWIGQSILDLVHPDDHERILRSLAAMYGKGIGTPIEIRTDAASGWHLTEIVGSSTRWFGTDVLLLCLRDQAERRGDEPATGREAPSRSLVHGAASLIMVVSEAGIIESAADVITRLLGHDPGVLVGQPLSGLVTRPDKSKFKDALAAARRGAPSERPVTARVDLLRHDQGVVPFELHFVNLLDDPSVEAIVITGHDVTAQAAAERALGDAVGSVDRHAGFDGRRDPGDRQGRQDH